MKYRMEWTYQTKKKKQTVLSTEYLPIEDVITFADDFIQTGRVKNLEILSEDDVTWTLKEIKKLNEIVKDEPHEIYAYFDGGYHKATKLAGFGAVIYYTQSNKKYRIRVNASVDGITSNNEAEYAACLFLVNLFEEYGISKQSVTIKGDSQVVLNQLAGEWPCYEEEFTVWLDRIEATLKSCQLKPVYEHITRKENHEADKLATQALNGIEIKSKLLVSEELNENE
ncbi:reverse transcriptase-like protein [Metabacillus malikii]|uniref:Ribonuclease HI n=1 Tax=Metabacillus malikii TaxID=1504265 RepID=A0ABT9ZAG0_9BACI|nr:reverse transcriptase-like protein [Metabacillus malikii]MDQ0228832.1 ribonuclease HI [Metabacillus malikii]